MAVVTEVRKQQHDHDDSDYRRYDDDCGEDSRLSCVVLPGLGLHDPLIRTTFEWHRLHAGDGEGFALIVELETEPAALLQVDFGDGFPRLFQLVIGVVGDFVKVVITVVSGDDRCGRVAGAEVRNGSWRRIHMTPRRNHNCDT